MNIVRSLGSFLLVAGVLLVVGCSDSSSPTSPGSNDSISHAAGAFGYTQNGTLVERATNPAGSSASAIVMRGQSNGMSILQIRFMVERFSLSSFHIEQLSLLIPFREPVPGTYNIGSAEATMLAQAMYNSDSLSYSSTAGGSVVITEFDTINNLVSGTFSFDLQLDPPPSGTPTTIHVTGGYFEKTPIYAGNFGQGTMTATVSGVNFNANAAISAFTTTGLDALTILGINSLGEEMTISIARPKVGTFPLVSGFSIASNGASFYGNSVSCDAGSGSFTITKYDKATHRMDATFTFTGTDATSSETVTVTNGKMDNVQWADL